MPSVPARFVDWAQGVEALGYRLEKFVPDPDHAGWWIATLLIPKDSGLSTADPGAWWLDYFQNQWGTSPTKGGHIALVRLTGDKK